MGNMSDGNDFLEQLGIELYGSKEVADAHHAKARAELDRCYSVLCPWGWCGNLVDPDTHRVRMGSGPVMCPCEHLPGWKSSYVDGLAKPAVPVKVKGRHGSRVARSRRRHVLPDWSALGEWLPASCAVSNG